jgi:DNA-binding MarR family transcriptional regulator
MESIQQEIHRLIVEAFLSLHEDWRRVSEQFGLTLFQFWTLINLEDPEGLPPNVLARMVLCDKSSMTRVVDDLEAKNLAVRKRSTNGDRRSQRIILTDQGRRMRESLLSARFENAAKQAQVLSESEMLETRLILQRFLEPLHSS